MANALSGGTGKLKSLWGRFANRAYREAFAEAKLRESIAAQVYYLRESRKLTQGELAALAETQQPAISRIERGEAALTAKSLEAVARAFDVALSIRFVPYSEIAESSICDRIEAYVPRFADDTPSRLVPIPATPSANVRSFRMTGSNLAFNQTPAAPIPTRQVEVALHA